MGIALHKKFIAAVAALSICVTGLSASQAGAVDRDTKRALAAILGLAVIGAVIAEERKDERRRKATTTTRNQPAIIAPSARIEPRPLPRRAQRQTNRRNAHRVLPQRCLREINTNRGSQYVFGANCMNRHYNFVSSLPQRCERRISASQGPRFGWGARCLNRLGYQTARR